MKGAEWEKIYKKIEELYAGLLVLLKEIFAEGELAEVSRLIDEDEYELALDAVVGIFVGKEKLPTIDIICLVSELLILMKCSDKEHEQDEIYYRFSKFIHCYTDRKIK